MLACVLWTYLFLMRLTSVPDHWVTVEPFATQQECEAERMRMSPEGVGDQCFQLLYSGRSSRGR